jgi:rod shape-determining protein MreC
VFSSSANQLTGKVNEQYNKVEDYFHLKKTNDSLVNANERLYNKLKANFQLPDTITKAMVDTVKIDSLTEYRKYTYLQATVIENSVNTQSNFIVLSRGKTQQLKEGMGLVDMNNAAVGITTLVTDDYAVVMSLLHKDSHISGKLFKGGETGTLSWDGKTPIITSGFSTTFPKGMLIGFVTEIIPEKSTNNFLIKFKTAADFYNLQYVYAIDNRQQEAVNQLLEKAKQQVK